MHTAELHQSEHLSRFTLYETKRGFWIVGKIESGCKYRVLHLRPSHEHGKTRFIIPQELGPTFSQLEIDNWIAQQKEIAAREDDEFRQKAPTAWGLLGLIRFTGCYYLCMVTRCSVVAVLGHSRVYHIDETKLVPLVHSSIYEVPDRRSAEARLASTFHSLDLAKTFYFSPTYDLTNTLQTNMGAGGAGASGGDDHKPARQASMFVWNSHLLTPVADSEDAPARMNDELRRSWFLKIIHGFIDQARISVFGNSVYITLIARRSHQFAGARFYKRGVNIQGYPANEVETEQIVSNQLHSQLSNRFTSYVQHRGSICVSWSQMSNNMSPQPPIRIDAVDPYYEAAAKHFDRMFSRYGYPIRVLNLVKTREKRARESALSHEFEACIRYLNQFLPQNRATVKATDLSSRMKGLEPVSIAVQACNNTKGNTGHGLELRGGVIEYTHWDMSRAAKSKSSEVMDYLERYAKETLESTSIFQSGVSRQRGVCRTNCIDCLDRTNAAQSVIAKYALGFQLHALGIIDKPKVDYDTDVMDLLTEMYHDHGDTLALQYGGSNLVNTVETYRRINQWTSHSRDLIESIRRFYSNSFMDAQRQDAINVFLGNYQYTKGTNLWDLSTDYYLHNSVPDDVKRSYRQWYEPRHLIQSYGAEVTTNSTSTNSAAANRRADAVNTAAAAVSRSPRALGEDSLAFTSLANLFLSQMNSTDRYSKQESPFEAHVKPKKRSKAQSAQVRDHFAEPPSEDSAFPAIDQLELLYARYLNSTGVISGVPAEEAQEDDEYIKYFSGAEDDNSDEYSLPETEWSEKPLNQWTNKFYAAHLECV